MSEFKYRITYSDLTQETKNHKGEVMTEEDEAFNDIERQARQRKESVRAAITPKVVELEMYDIGWNSALEMAAFKIEHDFKQAFGADTLSGLAIYIREMKK